MMDSFEKRAFESLTRERDNLKVDLRKCDLAYNALKLFKDDEIQKLLQHTIKLNDVALRREDRIRELQARIHELDNKLDKVTRDLWNERHPGEESYNQDDET